MRKGAARAAAGPTDGILASLSASAADGSLLVGVALLAIGLAAGAAAGYWFGKAPAGGKGKAR